MDPLPKNEKIIGMKDLKRDFLLPFPLHPSSLAKSKFLWQKRMLDIVVSLLVMVLVLSWLTPVLALLILIDSGYPVFYFQKRVGHHNKVFWCFKLRTMTDSPAYPQKNISKFGSALRYLKLDETPQFVNVLKGEMSLVGPRPHTLEDHEEFKHILGPPYELRHNVKPGITGLAQINGFEGPVDSLGKLIGRVHHDLRYANNRTLRLDIFILWETVIYIFKLFFKRIRKVPKRLWID